MNIRNFIKTFNHNYKLITLESISNQKQKTYIDVKLISDYLLLKQVIAVMYSFNSLELIIYYEWWFKNNIRRFAMFLVGSPSGCFNYWFIKNHF